MPIYKDDEIYAYWVDGELVCKECIEPAELKKVTLDDLLLEQNINDDDHPFCSRCKEQPESA